MGNLVARCYETEEDRELLRREENERKRQHAARQASEYWRPQQALLRQRQQRDREEASVAAHREQYRQRLLQWDGPATVSSSDGTSVEFRLLNSRVVLKLFHQVPRGALLKFTDKLGSQAKKWSTHVVGKFQCKQQQQGKKKGKGAICSSWTSGKIFTEIYFQDPIGARDSYKFLVLVWTQCCRKCNAHVLPHLDEGIYIERVVSRLQLYMGLRDAIHVDDRGASGLPPHRQDLCSACRAGKCQIAQGYDDNRNRY